jgi:hypothetical protein
MKIANYLIILIVGIVSSMIPFLHAGVQHGFIAILLASFFSLILMKSNINNLLFFLANIVTTYMAIIVQVISVFYFYQTEDFSSVLYFYSVTSAISIFIYSVLLSLIRKYK